MASRIAQWTLDVHDAAAMAAFWSQVLDYEIDWGGDCDEGFVVLRDPEGNEFCLLRRP